MTLLCGHFSVCLLSAGMLCAQVDFSALKELKYRNIGPFRGGRAVAVAGVTTQPSTYYFGATGGGIWKTTDSGATWAPRLRRPTEERIGGRAGRIRIGPQRDLRGHGRSLRARQRGQRRRRVQIRR